MNTPDTDAEVFQEGYRYDDSGTLIRSVYLDFRQPEARSSIQNLVKVCESNHAPELCHTVLISKPELFRGEGETLQADPEEARPTKVEVLEETTDDPRDLALAHGRDAEANRAAELVGAGIRRRTTSVSNRRTNTSHIEAGRSGWLYCAALEPTTAHEEIRLLESLPDAHNHYSFIRNRSAFALEVGFMLAAQLGSRGQTATVTETHGDRNSSFERPSVMIFHGPVIYVPEPYEYVRGYWDRHFEQGLDALVVPLFVKRERYHSQREYRFLVWSEAEPGEEKVALPVSPGLLAAMQGTLGSSLGTPTPIFSG